jgi:hypothetical protein
MLSDLYVPSDTDPASPRLDGQLNDEEDCGSDSQSGVEDVSDGKNDVNENLFQGTELLEPLKHIYFYQEALFSNCIVQIFATGVYHFQTAS